jgi:hypothetical protein
MHSAISPDALRRSSRVSFSLPLLVTSISPNIHFSEVCETMVVNAHGCAVRSPMKLDPGVPVYFHSMEGRQTTAHVVDCQPMGTDRQEWLLGAKLDQPDNFWGVTPCPNDWSGNAYFAPVSDAAPLQKTTKAMRNIRPEHEPSLKVVSTKSQVKEQVSEERLRTLIAEIVQPLHAEVTNLREQLARPEQKRSQFEVSLSYIPPELEEKLWERLRRDLGDQILQHVNHKAEQVLTATSATIEQKISSSEAAFQQQLSRELQGVESRAGRLSEEIGDDLRRQLHAGLEKFQQHATQAGTHLSLRGEEFYQSMQQRLKESHAVQVQEIKQVRADISAESSRQEALVGDLGDRIAKLDVFARRMESDADLRLSQMLNDVVARAQSQMETNAGAILQEMDARSIQELGKHIEAACGRLRLTQQAIEASVSESLKAHAEETVHSFEQALDELAGHAVGRWRRALARDLGSVARILGDEVRLEVVSDRSNNA